MSEQFERAALDDIIAKYGIKGVHPAADLLPMMSNEAFQAICFDVKAQGFLESIQITNEDLLIDGRNRLQVGWALQLDPPIERFNPTDAVAYVVGKNITRRHLTVGQRSMIAEKLAKLVRGRPNANLNVPNGTFTEDEAAKMLGVTRQEISRARFIRQVMPKLAKEVENGTVTLDGAYKKAKQKIAEEPERPRAAKSNKSTITLTGIVDKKLVDVPYPAPKGKHTFNVTNDAVDWASWTWNPVTGCLHGCKYCYAREMAYRDSYKASYPIQFAPLFHHERLDDPINTIPGTERPQDGRVFVCSMADLFGEWVPQEWIDKVFDAALRAPEWEYLFLTKFPQRYRRINLPPKAWFGASVDIQKRVKTVENSMPKLDVAIRWLSVEPMLEPIRFNDLSWCDLLVIGAQSETEQPGEFVPAFAPKLEWVIDLIAQARQAMTPVYLKPNLLGELTGTKPGMELPQEQPRRRKL
jgi:protein gp37